MMNFDEDVTSHDEICNIREWDFDFGIFIILISGVFFEVIGLFIGINEELISDRIDFDIRSKIA